VKQGKGIIHEPNPSEEDLDDLWKQRERVYEETSSITMFHFSISHAADGF